MNFFDTKQLKRCPTQVIRPKQEAVPVEKKEESESEEESSEEESSSDEEDDKKIEPDQKSSISPKKEENETMPTSGESYWPKIEKKDSLPTPDNLTLFIGQCKDIDEMLGVPTPVSPGSARIANSSSPNKQQQPFSFQNNEAAKNKEKSSSSSSSEEEESSSDLEEVEASKVKFHESKPQKPELGAYTEEIDSSAVRIRENKALNSELAPEEIDSSSVKIREPNIMHGHITKAPIRKAEECEIVSRGTVKNGTLVDNTQNRSTINNKIISNANALIEKMSVTDHRELRKTLYSLKQVFQCLRVRRLQLSGLSTRRPLLGLPLTQNHRRLRRQWCDERRMCVAEWNEVVFTDESSICLQHHDGRIRVWRHRGERMLNSCVMHHHTGPAPGIMVWGGIGYHSRTPLIELLPWPARSPDLSPIENMGSMVAQRLTQITPQLPHQIDCGNVWKLLGLLYHKNASKVSLNQCRGVWQR
ncbi:transposable element Tcb1 transposase [Trichonephila clavipes]|nr:transposable element Tcb1 transposase [Trichonephila clavipes]